MSIYLSKLLVPFVAVAGPAAITVTHAIQSNTTPPTPLNAFENKEKLKPVAKPEECTDSFSPTRSKEDSSESALTVEPGSVSQPDKDALQPINPLIEPVNPVDPTDSVQPVTEPDTPPVGEAPIQEESIDESTDESTKQTQPSESEEPTPDPGSQDESKDNDNTDDSQEGANTDTADTKDESDSSGTIEPMMPNLDGYTPPPLEPQEPTTTGPTTITQEKIELFKAVVRDKAKRQVLIKKLTELKESLQEQIDIASAVNPPANPELQKKLDIVNKMLTTLNSVVDPQ